jgi:hypothetical protein
MSEFQTHQQLILRVYEELAQAIHADMELDEEIQPIEIKQQGEFYVVFYLPRLSQCASLSLRRYSAHIFPIFLQGQKIPCVADKYAVQY